MRVVVVGAYGLIGGAVARRLQRDGHEVIGVGRDVESARRRLPLANWIELDLRRATPADWAAAVEAADAVVNCAGALQDSPRDDLVAVHVRAVAAMAAACAGAGVGRIVHISAAGIALGKGAFARTKLEAEAALMSADPAWVILRPTLVLASSAYGGSSLLRGLAAFPGFIPAVAPNAIVQAIWVDDVAEAVCRCLAPSAPTRIVCELAAREETQLGDILLAIRAWLGLPPAPVVPLPRWLGWTFARAADALAGFGWRSPMRSAAVRQLLAGVRARAADAETLLGFSPTPLAAALAANPAGVQERWYAKLYFVKPLALLTLIAFWAVSAVLGVVDMPAATLVLTRAGFGETLATGLVTAGCLADFALAIGAAFRRTARLALMGMIALTASYLGAATIWAPALWGDPLGPLVKSIPAAVLALAALAMMDER